MVEEVIVLEQESNNNKRRKRLLKQKQIVTTTTTTTTITVPKPFSNLPTYTIKKTGSRNGRPSAIQIVKDVKIHNFWGNIFRRKFEMHEYFSEAAFGSDSDKKIEYRELWKDPEYRKKYLPQDYLDSNTENELK
jgi:hypothetical protein